MHSHKYLIDEYPLLVLPTLAEKVGLNQSIALQQIHYWLVNTQRDAKDKQATHFFEGRWWVYNTYAEWREGNFPFWSERTIMRIFALLKGQGLILCREHDHRNKGVWVTIQYEKLTEIFEGGSCQVVTTSHDKLSPRSRQLVMTTGNTETTPEITTDTLIAVGDVPAPSAGNPGDTVMARREAARAKRNQQLLEAKDEPAAAVPPSPSDDITGHPLVKLFATTAKWRKPLTKEMMNALLNDIRIGGGGDDADIRVYRGGLLSAWDGIPGFEAFCTSRIPHFLSVYPDDPVNLLKHLRKLDKADGMKGFLAWRQDNPTLCVVAGETQAEAQINWGAPLPEAS